VDCNIDNIGIVGFAKGLGTGLIGVVAKPIVGVMDMLYVYCIVLYCMCMCIVLYCIVCVLYVYMYMYCMCIVL